MLVKDFSYNLPNDLIARHPVPNRDASRLMVLDKCSGSVTDDVFRNLTAYLEPGDLLVLNDTRVIPARLLGSKETGGRVEIFLVHREAGVADSWHCLLRASKKFQVNQKVILPSGMVATVCEKRDSDSWLVTFAGREPFDVWLEREGHIPLPPYLQRPDEVQDRDRYQTVFACHPGAIAAPTAGLHFTRRLLDALDDFGIHAVCLTLHTGLGTFQPVRVEQVEDHQIHSEFFCLPAVTADAVSAAKSRGNRVVAVGTTTARTLEYCSDSTGSIRPQEGEVDIFIYPGYTFKVVDALITNFHLPESTLFMLVSAFAGRSHVMKAYQEAVDRRFRFYSYGDAMLIV
jgi:S-adenosylmethionine:tRNA ribosyltransferase-isomerase